MREEDASKLTISNKRLETATRLAAMRLADVSQFVRCIYHALQALVGAICTLPQHAFGQTGNRYKAVPRQRTSSFGGLPSVNDFKSSLASGHVDTMPLHRTISKSKLNPLNKAQPSHRRYRSTYLPDHVLVFLITIIISWVSNRPVLIALHDPLN
ncbi:hypothetical protein FVEG_15866 [Fusarium verticillioides 7600]|uniref:Uncharacterized protein n=1 Tax=Gibberella moniliformis (strain M3125 / FGSC 7600) TaxID=334819 RepID=W7M2P8_GIBM7|nr:hypothetical protein FVEG_15866 [Fusarium verticillioides 7600]EWG45813.1 hypothetical protein FVEG_15866 [Fusarium verticillioides 7600]